MDDKKAEEIATKYPGHINFSGQINGHYSGALAVVFDTVRELNEYFKINQHVIVVGLWPLFNGSILAMYTTQMEQQDLRDLAEWGEKVEDFLASKREERLNLEISNEKAKQEAEAAAAKYVTLGKHCEANHKKTKDKK